jgi:hypothetical protein
MQLAVMAHSFYIRILNLMRNESNLPLKKEQTLAIVQSM